MSELWKLMKMSSLGQNFKDGHNHTKWLNQFKLSSTMVALVRDSYQKVSLV